MASSIQIRFYWFRFSFTRFFQFLFITSGSGKLGALSGNFAVRSKNFGDPGKLGVTASGRLGVQKEGTEVRRFGVCRTDARVSAGKSLKLGDLQIRRGERSPALGEWIYGEKTGEPLVHGGAREVSKVGLLSPSSNISNTNEGISVGLSSFTAKTLSACRADMLLRSVTWRIKIKS